MTPYAIGALGCISKSLRWIGKPNKPFKKKTHHNFDEFVFEQGDTGQKDFKWLMDEAVRAGGGRLDAVYPIFKPKTLLPLQGCGLLTWEQRYALKKHLDHIDEPWRESLRELSKVPHKWGYIDFEKIIDWAGWLGVPRRGDDSFERRTWRPRFAQVSTP